MLLKGGATVDLVSAANVTALHAAAKVGRRDAVQALLDHGAEMERRTDAPFKDTALSLAIRYGHLDTFEALFRAGANLHVRVGQNHTESALLLAVTGHQANEVLPKVLDALSSSYQNGM